MPDGNPLTTYSGPLAWAGTIAAAVAGGIASALNFRGELATLRTRIEAMEEAARADLGARVALRDEVLGKLRELGAELRRDLIDREPSSINLKGLVDSSVQAAVALANEKHLERLMELRDRVSEITGTVKGIVGGGRR